ncbi:hypothetical protein VTN00DRAFT_4947 [Thermoascus crustaceus]|uniref:uncharacterized protein n=1 Tax=Thermoascus crustaceus TaxID=5088 RepID=UPI00374202F9
MSVQEVAIIGAGLSGLALALALHQQSIPCTVYEARDASLNIGGAVMLTPNALKVLDTLGVYNRVRPKGYECEFLYFRDDNDRPLDEFELGGQQKYGYKALRIHRHELITEMLSMIRERQIPIQYGKKFVKIASESDKEVVWESADGIKHRASFLVGADGIHSRVRQYLYPDLEPRFTHIVAITAELPTRQLKVPNNYPLPATIMNRRHGAFLISPQLADGSEVLIVRQKHEQELDRDGWNKLLADKAWCIDFLRSGKDDFPEIVRNAVADIQYDKVSMWPFYFVPKLETWVSRQCRVVILGDAAHAVPPSTAQGVNQAMEDIYTFARVLAVCGRREVAAIAPALKTWHHHRQERIDRLLELNVQINTRRMPKLSNHDDVKNKNFVEDKFELEWLYTVDLEKMVQNCLPNRSPNERLGNAENSILQSAPTAAMDYNDGVIFKKREGTTIHVGSEHFQFMKLLSECPYFEYFNRREVFEGRRIDDGKAVVMKLDFQYVTNLN